MHRNTGELVVCPSLSLKTQELGTLTSKGRGRADISAQAEKAKVILLPPFRPVQALRGLPEAHLHGQG